MILCRIFFRLRDLDAKIIPELYNNNTGKGFKLEEEYWMLDNRYWMLDTRYWMLGTRYWILKVVIFMKSIGESRFQYFPVVNALFSKFFINLIIIDRLFL